MSSKDNNGTPETYSRNDNIQLMINENEYEDIEERFQSLLSRYQIGLKTSMRVSDFIFCFVNLLQFKCHRINFRRAESYIDFPHWIKSKKATINAINKKYKICFQCAA